MTSMDDVSFMAQYGERLVDNGYAVIPIMPGSKVPGRFTGGDWSPYPNWTRHCDRPTKGFEVDIWRRWPGCGVGIACGAVVGIDIDLTDAALAIQITHLANEMLGETPCLRIGRAPKRLLVYRTETPFAGHKRLPLEVLAHGQQFVAYAIHPGTGQPYEWPEDGLLDVPLAKLPAVSEAQVMAWLDQAYAMIPAELRPHTLIGNHERPGNWRGPSDPRGTYEAVQAALAFIPNDDLDGHSWITMGNAIKAALGDEGKDLWLAWSRQSSKSGASGRADTPERRWAKLRPHSIGAGSVYTMAIDRGWIPPPEITLNAATAEQTKQPHPASALLAKAAATTSRPVARSKPYRVPPELFDVGGALGMFVEHCNATAISPQPFLALAAGICLVGALAGRKYRTATDLRTNVYAIGVADSGGGKDHARKVTKQLLGEAGLTQYMGGEDIASGAAVYTALARHPSILFQIDEFGDWLAELLGPKAPAHRKQIAQRLKTLYSSASTFLSGTEYADQSRNGRPREDIQQPHACLYGTTTPAQLWAAIAGASLQDGLMARILLFVSPCSYPEEQAPVSAPPSAELIAALQGIAAGPTDPEGGELGKLMLANTWPNPLLVANTPEAEDAYRSLRREQLERMRRNEGTHVTAIVGRLAENAMKLALVRAVSRDPAAPTIAADDVAWGRALSLHCIETLLREADAHVANNPFEALVKRALAIIRKHGPVTERDMIHKGWVLPERDRGDVMRTLVEGGYVIATPTPPGAKGGRPTVRYSAIAPTDETSSGVEVSL
jgi:hypothetical protein